MTLIEAGALTIFCSNPAAVTTISSAVPSTSAVADLVCACVGWLISNSGAMMYAALPASRERLSRK